ncbi:hypothetical protein [Nocardia sp. NBC_01388]|uniref:hypothetical protein n=1 Tax=Nocardia sp. NBC_01388 TaxID=2903596 RepID=UPI0032562AF4
MPDQPLIAEDRLRQFRDDDNVCASPFERAMAEELLVARARIAELETELDLNQGSQARLVVKLANAHPERLADALAELDLAHTRIAELEQQAGQSLGYVVVAEQPVHRAAVMHRYRAIGCIWPESEGAEIQLAERSDRALMDPAWFSGMRHFIAELREVTGNG